MTSSISQHVVSTINTRRQAIAAVRGCADALIEQMTRQAAGMDRGRYRDDTRSVDCRPDNSIRARVAFNVAVAFALSRKFANVDTGTLADLVEAGIVESANLPGLPEGVAAFQFVANEGTETVQTESIDMTPTWAAMVGQFRFIIENANKTGRDAIWAEIARMAQAADNWNAHVTASKVEG